MRVCRAVVLRCPDPSRPPSLPRGTPLASGDRVGYCEAEPCIPSPCVVDISTNITVTKLRRYKVEELEDDVAITEYVDGRPVEMYVYPRDVWRKVERLYVEPLKRGDPVKEHLLLIGAPGTGKSVLANLIASMVGVNTVHFSLGELKSKWYGETERNVINKLNEALQAEPSIMIADDAETILTQRQYTKSFASGVESTETEIKDMILGFLEYVVKERRRVLVIASTNFSPSAIDEAMIRGGRFGEPVFIPLPSYEALYRYALFAMGSEEKARDLAYRCVTRGLTISDLKSMIKYVSSGLEPEFRRLGGRGYSRMYSEPVRELVESRKLRSEVEKLFAVDKDKPTTLWFDVPAAIGLPILAQVLMNLRRPGMVITDPRFADEFVFSVDTTKAVAVVPTHLPPEVHAYVRMNTRQPMICVGTQPPKLEAYAKFLTVLDVYQRVLDENIEPLMKAVTSYYGIQLAGDAVEQAQRIVRLKKVKVVDLLLAMATAGKVSEDLMSRLMLS